MSIKLFVLILREYIEGRTKGSYYLQYICVVANSESVDLFCVRGGCFDIYLIRFLLYCHTLLLIVVRLNAKKFLFSYSITTFRRYRL